MNHEPVRWCHQVLHRWYLALAGVVLLFGVASLVVITTGPKREAAMQLAAARATAAVNNARVADARSWAPVELRTAEGALHEARSAHRIEADRLWIVPARVVAVYAEAERTAAQALAVANRQRATAASTAESLLAEATIAVSSITNLASTIRLEPSARGLLARAQAALVEARVYEREHDLGQAAARARETIELAGQVRDRAAAMAARYADADTVVPWRRWKEQTIAWSRREDRPAIVITKEVHELTLYMRGEPVKTYTVDLGTNWIANKSRAGDDATPEGRYRVVSRVPNGAFYKALLLDYPNAEDRTQFNRARRSGALPPSAGIGGLIEIHGDGGRGRDWTEGCIALTNADMDDLFARVGVGTPVTIVGSDDFGAIAEFAARHRNGARPSR